MIYVKYENERISDIRFEPTEGYIETQLFDPKLKAYLENNPESDTLIKEVLQELDQSLVRSIEDLVDVLIQKELILFTDLPEPVQNKLLFKKSMRHALNSSTSILHEEEELTF